MKLLIILLVIALVYFANGYITVKEKCPKIPIAKNVIRKNEKMVGGWYVHKYFENDFEKDSKCLYLDIHQFDHQLINSTYLIVRKKDNEKILISLIGYPVTDSLDCDYNFTYYYNNTTTHLNAQILIMEDDYTVSWACIEDGNSSIRYTWIESRHKVIPKKLLKHIKKFYETNNMGWSELTNADHDDDCNYEIN